MKTTIFLLALYGVFGFFACKREDALMKPVANQLLPAGKKTLKHAMAPQAGNNSLPDAGELLSKK